MSEHGHEDIARRLRAEGQAGAPPDLLPSVMAEVRAEPRRRRRRLGLPSIPPWRPVAAWATAAAALVAVGFGISRLDLTTNSSSSAGSAVETHAPAAATEGASASIAPGAAETFTVSPKAASSILGRYLYAHKQEAVTSATAGRRLNITVPGARFSTLSTRLRAAQRQLIGRKFEPNATAPSGAIVIKLMRAHTR